MSENLPLLVHIGYHKTASSYLQAEFFTSQHGFARWPRRQFDVHPHLVALGPYETVSAETRELLDIQRNEANQQQLHFVVSHERLSGHPASGGYDSKVLAERIKEVFPAAKILIVIREQCSVIRSAYSQFITEGGSLNLHRFLHDPEPNFRRVPCFSLTHFEYAPTVNCYHSLFGKENVLVMAYESFVSEPARFLNQIGEFVQGSRWRPLDETTFRTSSVNTARRMSTQLLRRQLNGWFLRNQLSNHGLAHLPSLIRLFEKSQLMLDRLIPKTLDRVLVDSQKRAVERFVGDYYASFNQETSALTQLDLKSCGYRV